MKKFRLLCLILSLCLVFALVPPRAQALEAPEFSARSAIVVDLGSGETVWEKNADEVRAPASLTKIMTGLLAAEAVESGAADPDEPVTAGADCRWNMDDSSSNAGIVPGETMSFRDLFICAMVVSANEACNVLASRLDGGVGAFVEHMNRRAAELGCESTRYFDPNGLSHENRTTARELSVILREALRHETFLAAFTTTHYEVPATNRSDERSLVTTDALTARDAYYSMYGDYYYDYALGAKTGFTRAAGYCLASVAEKDGVRLLAVVLGCPGPLTGDSREPESFRDTIRLYDWIFGSYAPVRLFAPGEELCRAPVARAADGESAALCCAEDPVVLLPIDASWPGEIRIEPVAGPLCAPLPAGAVLGRVTVCVDGVSHGPYDLINRSEVPAAPWTPEGLAAGAQAVRAWSAFVLSLAVPPRTA